MSFLSPWGLLWVGSVPVLVWLWRLASTQRQIRIPSLIPFEHLLRRAPKRRMRLVITPLFWLQLASCLGLAFALARPVLFQRHANTVLVVLDTSTSMGAEGWGGSAFAQAKRALVARIARKIPAEQWFIVATAPLAPLTQQATSDGVELARTIEDARLTHLGGSLAAAARIGGALLGIEPDATIVATDEPRPADAADTGLHWMTVGEAAANVAIVGLDAQGPLCSVADANVVVTVQNFSNETRKVVVSAMQGSRRLADAHAEFPPHGRRSLLLAVPNETAGLIEISLATPGDSLEVDNHAWLTLHRSATLPITVRSRSAPFKDTVSAWLGACEALRWSVDAGSRQASGLVITDREDETSGAVASMVFDPPAEPGRSADERSRPAAEGGGMSAARPVLSHWVVSSGHPIGSYLAPVEVVAAALNVSPTVGTLGVPVVSALVSGRNVPVIVADERDGHRLVSVRLDPSATRASTPVLLAFFNSLRWLMGRSEGRTTGEPLLVSGFKPGRVSVRRPDGMMDNVDTDDGTVIYDLATLAGPYQFSQGSTEAVEAVNCFDPIESNLLDRPSTWRSAQQSPAAPAVPRPVAHPLSSLLMSLVLALLLIEWWRYSAKSTVHRPPSTVVPR